MNLHKIFPKWKPTESRPTQLAVAGRKYGRVEALGAVYNVIDGRKGGWTGLQMFLSDSIDFVDYLKQPTVYYGHDYGMDSIIGFTDSIRQEENGLYFTILFDLGIPNQKNAYDIIKQGVIQGLSVGLYRSNMQYTISTEMNGYEGDEVTIVSKATLFEISFTPSPFFTDTRIVSINSKNNYNENTSESSTEEENEMTIQEQIATLKVEIKELNNSNDKRELEALQAKHELLKKDNEAYNSNLDQNNPLNTKDSKHVNESMEQQIAEKVEQKLKEFTTNFSKNNSGFVNSGIQTRESLPDTKRYDICDNLKMLTDLFAISSSSGDMQKKAQKKFHAYQKTLKDQGISVESLGIPGLNIDKFADITSTTQVLQRISYSGNILQAITGSGSLLPSLRKANMETFKPAISKVWKAGISNSGNYGRRPTYRIGNKSYI